MPERADVDAWHGFLEAQNAPGAPPAVNVTQPSDSATFNCYAFNFYDPNAATSARPVPAFEVQAFANEDWLAADVPRADPDRVCDVRRP